MNSVNFFAHTDRSFSSVADKSTSIAGQGCFAQYQMYVLAVDVMYRRSFYLYGVGRDPQPVRERMIARDRVQISLLKYYY